MNDGYLYGEWAEGRFPFDGAACGFCLSQHALGYCTRPEHEALRVAAKKANLVKLVNRLRKGIERDKEEIKKVFLKLRRKYKECWA